MPPRSSRALPYQPPTAGTVNLRREVSIRPLASERDFRACVEIQKQTWGEQFSECVPPSILKVCQRIGGVAAGAFDSGDRLLGFVFGMTGVDRGELVHWSDMLAVRPEARNLGLGEALKQYQANTLRALGVTRIYWTFDPLVARNAHLNLNKLGAEVLEYVVDMYGETESELHRLGTDRFVISWRISNGERPGTDAELLDRASSAPVLEGSAEHGFGELGAPLVRIEVPANIEAVQRASLEEAVRWRALTRAAFSEAMEQGYRVAGFVREAKQGPCYYLLARDAEREVERPPGFPSDEDT